MFNKAIFENINLININYLNLKKRDKTEKKYRRQFWHVKGHEVDYVIQERTNQPNKQTRKGDTPRCFVMRLLYV